MSAQLKQFGSRIEPKSKALKEYGSMPVFGEMVMAPNKNAAQAISYGNFLKMAPEHVDNYFKPKIWEDRPDLPRMQLQAGFCTEFFETVATWNPETNEPEYIVVEPGPVEDENPSEGRLWVVANLGLEYQAATLALFGHETEISDEQYSQIVDLKNDDESSFARELMEAITRTPRILALETERQAELLAHLRVKCKNTAQWPDIKNAADKWLDTPADKRESPRTKSGATLGGGIKTDRTGDHNLLSLEHEICQGLLARALEFDIYNAPLAIELQASDMMNKMENKEFLATRELFVSMPGVLDYSRACIIATVKTTPEALYLDPAKHLEYLNRVMVESDHARPTQEMIDIACGRSSLPLPQNAETEDDTPRRQVAILAQIDRAMSGDTSVISKDEADELLGMLDIEHDWFIDTLSFDLWFIEREEKLTITDDEIHHLTVDALHKWVKIPAGRVKILSAELVKYREEDTVVLEHAGSKTEAGDAFDEWRETEAGPAAVIPEQPRVTAKPYQAPPVELTLTSDAPTYEQQLTVAALQGLCANPAYCGNYEDIPSMAVWLAAGVMRLQNVSDC